jgi:hypothetical protein
MVKVLFTVDKHIPAQPDHHPNQRDFPEIGARVRLKNFGQQQPDGVGANVDGGSSL